MLCPTSVADLIADNSLLHFVVSLLQLKHCGVWTEGSPSGRHCILVTCFNVRSIPSQNLVNNSMWWHMSTMAGKFNKEGHAIRKSGFNFWLWYSFALCHKSFHLPKLFFPQFKWDICLLFQIQWELIHSYLGKHSKFAKWEPLLGVLLVNTKQSGSDSAIWNPFHATSATTINRKCLFLTHWL